MKVTVAVFVLTLSFFAQASYESYFPQYYEYCTATQLKYRPEFFDGAVGGPGGHGFMYIHGLCKDYSKSYPQVIPCDENSSHEGVGISLDSDYANVAWVAVPGRDLMMFGDIERRAVTEEDIEAVARKAIDLKIFENVKMKPDYVTKNAFNSIDYQKAAAVYSIGTDIAVNWARELRCVRIPVNKEAIGAAADYLNGVNNKYYLGNKTYEWSMIKNNCTHLAMNTSHAMGINSSIETDRSILRQIFNLAVPANAYLMYMDKALLKNVNEKKILKSKAYKKFGYHPSQVGTLMIHLKAYPDNVMFETSELKSITLPRKNILKIGTTPASYDKYARPENTQLLENAKRWKSVYEGMTFRRDKGLQIYLQNQKDLIDAIINGESEN